MRPPTTLGKYCGFIATLGKSGEINGARVCRVHLANSDAIFCRMLGTHMRNTMVPQPDDRSAKVHHGENFSVSYQRGL